MNAVFAVPVGSMTPDQAGALVDMVDRAVIKVDAATYENLLLVASGHAALVRDAERSTSKPPATCSVCKKEFEALRPGAAKYCSNACRGKATRRAARLPKTPVRYSGLGFTESPSSTSTNTGAVDSEIGLSSTLRPPDSEDAA